MSPQMIELSATDAAKKIAEGEITSEELTQACLDRIAAVDGDIEAWEHLDPEFALEQARALDGARATGVELGPLHGIPVGVKDIYDTAGWPTENGTPLDAGRQPTNDCAAVTRLREAGAVIMGKTVTTELAVFSPGKTRNPHNPEHTPGGSSSGSAAAVASHMVPLGIGSQTNGSTIRPAAYCGVYGFKPTFGRISRHGMIPQSGTLDHAGVFARDIHDIAVLAEAMMGHDDRDRDMAFRTRARLSETVTTEPPLEPRFAFVKTHAWEKADAETQEAFGELTDELGADCEEVPLPDPFEDALATHRTIHTAEMAKCYAHYYERGKGKLSDVLRGMIEEGQQTSAFDYLRALEMRDVFHTNLNHIFDRFDAILTPATTGTAPKGLDATGDPSFCSLWTLTGVPAVSVPLMAGADGLPLGVQLIGPRGDDARLLRTARWLVDHLSEANA